MKNVFTKLMTLATVTLLLNSCYIKEDIPFVPPVVENPTEYVVTIYTVDASNNNTPMDISLPLFGINSSQVTRIAAGTYEFRPTSAGTFSFKASKTGYYDAFASVNLPKGGVNEVINSSVIVPLTQITTPTNPDAATYTLWGRVIKGVDNANLSPTTVTCSLRGKVVTSTITITNNLFKIEFPEPGIYDITVNAAGYESVTLTQNISKIPDGQEFVSELTVPMYLVGTFQGQTYSVRGTVMNINRVVQLGASMGTQINGVNATTTLPNGTYEVLGLTNNQNISFVFSADSCYPTSFQMSISQYAGTPNIVYDVYLKPVPAGSAVQSEIIAPDPTTGETPTPTVIVTPSSTPIPNQPVSVNSVITIPASTILTDAANQQITTPIAISATTLTQMLPAVTVVSDANLGTSLFELSIQPNGISTSNPMTVAITNPFGSLIVDDSYLATDEDATTKGIFFRVPLTPNPLLGTLVGSISRTRNFVGYTIPATQPTFSNTLVDGDQYSENFYNRTGQNLSNVTYEYYAKTGNVYAPGNTPEELVNAANISFKNNKEKAFLLDYIKSIITMQLGATSYTLTPVKTIRETNIDCAANQYMKTTTINKFSERTCTFIIKDYADKTVTLVVKVHNYITSSTFDLDIYSSHHTTGSHFTNNGAGGGYGSSNL